MRPTRSKSALKMRMRAQFASLPFRPAYITQCCLASTNMRLTAIRNGLRDKADRRVAIAVCRLCNGRAGAAVATHESCQGGDRLVADLCVGIRGHNLNEVSYNVTDANILVTAPLTAETMESALADGRDRIAQSHAKSVRGRVARVMIQKGWAEAPHRRIRMPERRGLYGGDGNLLA
jgi:hypothetical protein